MNRLAKLFSKNVFDLKSGTPLYNVTATLKNYPAPADFKDVQFPDNPKLRFMEKVPQYPAGIKPPKCFKRLVDIRGPELIHNALLHKQYGVVALTGGYLVHGHFEMIRHCINRKMDPKRMFAVWRVDAPWKPMTRKGQGKRMGGGKGSIHHYATPVKAGRIIFEMGGYVEFEQVERLLKEVVGKMPFKSKAVSQQIMEETEAEAKRQEEENINPYTFKYVVENNMLGCHKWISPYDFLWHGKYR